MGKRKGNHIQEDHRTSVGLANRQNVEIQFYSANHIMKSTKSEEKSMEILNLPGCRCPKGAFHLATGVVIFFSLKKEKLSANEFIYLFICLVWINPYLQNI